ncbi:MAG: chaperone NapD [Bacteroidetes bacterium]|jgi:periplasmic nitrate reductase NapD|nr:chaperone NapD [Bacteroidota bacterium]MBT6687837.1 chaperone NapD [Bacteroidota bacterium]MBT7142095.1 chaperone NapD [Bacteroidota bacterium]MBT7492366.1 chaperone NapD [Bacteroidota bacterium]
MNISSAVIKTLPDSINEVIEIIKASNLCEYHLDDGKGKIVVSIEGESIDDEIKAINELKKIPKVISADIVYSYMEDEIGEEIAKLEENELVPPWLNNDSIRAEDIDYKGELKINKKRKQ